MIPFGPWMPDNPEFGEGYLIEAFGVLPQPNRYDPLPSLRTVLLDALDGECIGIGYGIALNGNVYNYLGTATSLYEYRGSTLRQAGTGYSGTGSRWRFARWGNQIIATNGIDPVQRAVVGANFAPLVGSGTDSPPHSKHIAVVSNDFLVVGNTSVVPYQVRWSAAGDIFDWDEDPLVTLADLQDIFDGEPITGMTSGTYGLVFTRSRIYRMDYVGPPPVFRITRISDTVGCVAPDSIVKIGSRTAFLSEGGFYITSGTGDPQPISEDVDTWFFERLNSAEVGKVQGAANTEREAIVWVFPSGISELPDLGLIWCFAEGPNVRRWAYGTAEVESVARVLSAVVGENDMDSNIFAMDEQPYRLMDVSAAQTETAEIMGTNWSHQISTFTGQPQDARVVTSEYGLKPGQRAKVHRARMIVQGGDTLRLRCGERDSQGEEPVTWGPYKVRTPTGDVTPRSNAWYHRFEVTTTGEFDSIQGVDLLEVRDGGTR